MAKTKNKIKSSCCHASVRYSDPAPDFIGDNSKTMQVGTCYCICSKCNQPCNMYIPIRRTWIKNPKTQIQKDKREKTKRKETNKEIKEIGCA